MEWLCREMDRLFGGDPEAGCFGSAAVPDPGCVGPGRPAAIQQGPSDDELGHRVVSEAPLPVYGSNRSGARHVPSAGIRRMTGSQSQVFSSPLAYSDRPDVPGMCPEDSPTPDYQRRGRHSCNIGSHLYGLRFMVFAVQSYFTIKSDELGLA